MNIEQIIESLQFSNIVWQIITPLIFSVFDIITGFIQAVINNNVETSKMRVGLLHKFLILVVIILSFVIDFTFNFRYFSKVVCIYVIFMELMSIAENLTNAGIDMAGLSKILKIKNERRKKDETK